MQGQRQRPRVFTACILLLLSASVRADATTHSRAEVLSLNSGLMSVGCHEKFKTCIKKVKKSGKVGFSKECPYEAAMPTMIQGMDMAILFSQLGIQKSEL
ncbi:hypothetical protein B296_00031862 [Ensete ventricosum]|uniref:Pectinesterase inhibitor domain-containing protein n=1 Tax=Ensete ventricosum TaxID=4639 RepID=A0A426XLS2_ENSVE|nr:hypothetical protein B296_00031862 [Ensete ventricosum]